MTYLHYSLAAPHTGTITVLLLLLLGLSVDHCGQTISSWAEVSRANVERLIKNKVSAIVADGSTRYTCSAVGSVHPASSRTVTFLHEHSSFSPSSLCSVFLLNSLPLTPFLRTSPSRPTPSLCLCPDQLI